MTTEQEILNTAARMHVVADSWQADPTPTQAMADGMGTLSDYLLRTAALIEDGLTGPPPGPVEPIIWPDRLPAGTRYEDSTWDYNVQVYDDTQDWGGRLLSGAKSAVVLVRGSGTIRNAKATESGGDGIKVLRGSRGATIENIHVYGIGKKPGAHADGLQITGGVHDLTLRNAVMDVPIIDPLPGASRVVTSALIISSQDEGNGRIDVYGGGLYGGGFTVYNISKGFGNAIADLHFHDVPFYVNRARTVPQWGLFSCEARPTFHGNCRVVEFETGKVLSTDPWAWDQK